MCRIAPPNGSSKYKERYKSHGGPLQERPSRRVTIVIVVVIVVISTAAALERRLWSPLWQTVELSIKVRVPELGHQQCHEFIGLGKDTNARKVIVWRALEVNNDQLTVLVAESLERERSSRLYVHRRSTRDRRVSCK